MKPRGGNKAGLPTIDGTIGSDLLVGTLEDENLRGKRGDDTLIRMAGDDLVEGDQGNDTLIAGEGTDILDGGADYDAAHYRDASVGNDGTVTLGEYASVLNFSFAIGAAETTIIDLEPGDGDWGEDTLIDVEEAVFSDGNADGIGAAGLITVYLDGRNNAAMAVWDQLAPVGEDSILTISSAQLLANDREFDGEEVWVGSVTSTSYGVPLTLSYEPDGSISEIAYRAAGEFDYLAQDERLLDFFEYTAIDPSGAGSSARVLLTVVGRNDAPLMGSFTHLLGEDDAEARFDLASMGLDVDRDDDGTTLSYAIVGGPAKGTAEIEGTELVFRPGTDYQNLGAGQTGDALIFIQATDRQGATSNVGHATLRVTGENDGVSILAGPVTFDVAEAADGSPEEQANRITTLTDAREFTDPDQLDSHTLTVTRLSPDLGGTFAATLLTEPTGLTNGTYEWTYAIDDQSLDGLAGGEEAFEIFGVTITDSHGAATTQTQQFRLIGANDRPDAVDDVLVVSEDGPVASIDVLANDDAVDSDDNRTTLLGTSRFADSGARLTSSSQPGNGVITYDPTSIHEFQELAAGETASDRITYRIRDSHNAQSTGFVDVTVNGLNDAPTLREGGLGAELLLAAQFGDNSVHIPNGTGTFLGPVQLFGTNEDLFHTAIEAADLDGDGDPDVITAASSGQPGRVYLNDGRGGLIDTGQALPVADGRDVALADVDGDGDIDAVFASTPFGDNQVFLNDGTGVMTDTGERFAPGDVRAVALGDIDGDGDVDAVARTPDGAIWLNDGTGRFIGTGQVLAVNAFTPDVDLADLDGDGDLDLFVSERNRVGNQVFLNDGAGFFADTGQAIGSLHSEETELVDVDGDGDLDAIVASLGTGPAGVYLNDGTGTFSDAGQALGTRDSRGMAVADVDGDGDIDLVLANNFVSELYLNDGAGLFTLWQTFAGRYLEATFADLDGFARPRAVEDGNGPKARVAFR